MEMSDTKISDPAPNWCRTCGRRPNDPMAALCLDTHHRTLERLHPQPAELAEQQGAELPPLPASSSHDPHTGEPLFTESKMRMFANATLAATGKQQVGEVQGNALRGRTPADYAIEHAGYLVTAANQVLEARNELDALVLRREEDDDVDEDEMQAAQECVGDANSVLRIAIHEFEKRRDRALAARQPGAQVPTAWLIEWKNGVTALTKDASEAEAHREYKNCTVVPVYAALPAQGIDLGRLQLYRLASGPLRTRGLHKDDTGSWVKIQDVERLIGQRGAAPGVAPLEMRICETRHVMLKPGCQYVFTVDPNCDACADAAAAATGVGNG